MRFKTVDIMPSDFELGADRHLFWFIPRAS